MKIYHYETISSTNAEAKRMILDGAREGVLLARHQTAGRGRLGRSFFSENGIFMSVILSPEVIPFDPGFLTSAVAVAVCRAVTEKGFPVGIKWVNDIHLDGKKICGILVRPRFEGEICVGAIVGVGVNLLDRPFPPALAGIATSVQEACGVRLDAEALAERIVSLLIPLLGGEGEEEAMDEYRSCSCLIGRRVRAEMADRTLIATVTGIDRDGGLILTDEVGRILAMRSGRVRAISESFP